MFNLKSLTLAAIGCLAAFAAVAPAQAGGTGACCFDNGSCVGPVSEPDCAAFGGFYQGDGSDCGAVSCDVGACCLLDGTCNERIEDSCDSIGGDYQGDFSDCVIVICPQPTGACCMDDGTCMELEQQDCELAGGFYQGNGTRCGTTECGGACCFMNGTCADGGIGACLAAGGSFQGFGSSCATSFCGIGACCISDGTCQDLSVFACDALDTGDPGDITTIHLGEATDCVSTQVQAQPFSFSLSPNADMLTFNQFDDLAGTRSLKKVLIILNGKVAAEITVENLSPDLFITDLFVDMEAALAVVSPNLDPLLLGFGDRFFAPPGTILDPFDGVVGSGDDFYDFGELGVIGEEMVMSSDALELDRYTGDGTIVVDIVGEGEFTFGQSVAVDLTVDPFFAEGTVKVIYQFGAGAIGDFIWEDTNLNGIQDAGEPGIPDVRLELSRKLADGTLEFLEDVFTDAGGNYLFEALCAGDYRVVVDDTTLPPGYTETLPDQGANDGKDSDFVGGAVQVTLDTNDDVDVTIDGGFQPPCEGVIGDFIWDDLNRDGIQDPGEDGLPDVLVLLFLKPEGGGLVLIDQTTTDGNGFYQFTELCEGNYRVQVDPSTLPPGYTPSPPDQGGDDERDSDCIDGGAQVSLVTNGDVDNSIDCGFQPPCMGEIGDLLWDDLNRDGIQDPGEPGLPDVDVLLYEKLDGGGLVLLDQTTTGADGSYEFTGLCGGDYRIEVDPATLPAGYVGSPADQGGDDERDSDCVDGGVQVVLTGDDDVDNSIDCGFHRPCESVIGDFIWDDLDGDGIQDPGEPGIPGVRIELFRKPRGGGLELIGDTTTDAAGMYSFGDLCAGAYRIVVDPTTLPPDYQPTTPNQGGDDTRDSDCVGGAAQVKLPSDDTIDDTVDCGFVRLGACCLDDGTCVNGVTQDGCVFGLGGDFQGVNTVCEPGLCPTPKGACCFEDGSCAQREMDQCMTEGGAFQGEGVICTVGLCALRGACCFPDGSCIDDRTQLECESAGGDWQGDGSLCAPGLCPIEKGACCFDDGSCAQRTMADCQAEGGDFQGDGVICTAGLCALRGACCFTDGSCIDDRTQLECESAGGDWQGDGSLCAPGLCPIEKGACCFDDGSCAMRTMADCQTEGGDFQGDGVICTVGLCALRGACCFDDGSCIDDRTQFECEGSGGAWQGDGSVCANGLCPVDKGACCLDDGLCVQRTMAQCSAAGGAFQGDGVICSVGLCALRGACCFPDGSCADDRTQFKCEGGGGAWQGADSVCAAGLCPIDKGACCFDDGSCAMRTMADCQTEGGDFQGDGVICTVGLCALRGACCFTDGSCIDDRTQFECESSGGDWQGDASVCGGGLCPIEKGACCFDDGSCVQRTMADCQAEGGDFQGDGVICTAGLCALRGACCFTDGSCIDDRTQFECESSGGDWQGDASVCGGGLCPIEKGACCFDDGSCVQRTMADCQAEGGDFQGDGVICTAGLCALRGACCFTDGSCIDDRTQFECESTGGDWQGDASVCGGGLCPIEKGACCFDDGSCVQRTMADCQAEGGDFQGDGVICTAGLCALRGACCFTDGSCIDDRTQFECESSGGDWQGDASVCGGGLCPIEKGACCFDDGSCAQRTMADCQAEGGDFQGDGVICTAGLCALRGACCFTDGSCIDDRTQFECESSGGDWQGDASVCGGGLCPIEKGACCFDDGSCVQRTMADCQADGGDFQGDGVICTAGLCALRGACCFTDGSCIDDRTQFECESTGGDWQGDASVCGGGLCPIEKGACCFDDGSCAQRTMADCQADGGDFQGDGVICTAGLCALRGACCFTDGSCIDDRTQFECESSGGDWQGDASVCGGGLCPIEKGACCFDDGSCAQRTMADCQADGGDFQGDGVICTAGLCALRGACCFDDGACLDDRTQFECESAGGLWQGDGTDCGAGLCPVNKGACCFDDGSCAMREMADCQTEGGDFQGDGIVCSAGLCDLRGACCLEPGVCVDGKTQSECIAMAGSWQGPGTTCDQGLCPDEKFPCCLLDGSCTVLTEEACDNLGGLVVPGFNCATVECPEACCFDDGNCLFLFPLNCLTLGGTPQGSGTTCADVVCVVKGACCFSDGSCAQRTEEQCEAEGGDFQGDGVLCSVGLCAPFGACCLMDGTCIEDKTQVDCVALGGDWQGPGTSCTPELCPIPKGACCFEGGVCAAKTMEACEAEGGEFLGDGTVCAVGLCVDRGACCLPGGVCMDDVSQDECEIDLDGDWQGAQTNCSTIECAQGACCLPSGLCVIATPQACQAGGGIYQGDDVPCTPLIFGQGGRYRLRNHPDGGSAPPYYGLRYDELFDVTPGNDVFTFDFDDPGSEMYLDYNGTNVIRIHGIAYGGLDIGNGYDPAWSSFIAVEFWYTNVQDVPGDDDLYVLEGGPDTGTLTWLDNGEDFTLIQEPDGDGVTFRFGNEDDDQGHRGFPGLSGWGWFETPGNTADWLFTAVDICEPEVPVGACCFDDGSCLDLRSTDCTAQGGVPQGPGTECAAIECVGACCLPPPPPPGDFDCDGKVVFMTMIWDGAEPVRIKAYDGDTDDPLLADIDHIQIGDAVTIGPLNGPNDSYWQVFRAGTSTLLGLSKFHRSCSDSEMDGPEDCGNREGNGKSNESGLINDWILEGLVDESGASFQCGLLGGGDDVCEVLTRAACEAEGGSFQGVGTACEDVVCEGACCLPPPAEFDCDGKVVFMTMIWDGAEPVRIKAYDGAVGGPLLADIDHIQIGDAVTIGPLNGPNDSYWQVFRAGTSTLLGLSKFHRSCSDSEMDGPEDCGNREGNGKSNESGLINDWLLEGLVDESGASFTCGLTGNDCVVVTAADCAAMGGTFQGFGTACEDVVCGGAAGTWEGRVPSDNDDAEQSLDNGAMYMDSSDLELCRDSGSDTDTVGMRFTGVGVPQGALITNAYVQFTADETDSGGATLVFKGHDTDNAPSFGRSDWNISSRSTTSASRSWSPPAWDTVGESGSDQRTPDLSAVIQEIVSRSGWSEDNAIALIVTGSGTRTAESYDGSTAQAPLLHIEWATGAAGASPGAGGSESGGGLGHGERESKPSLDADVDGDGTVGFSDLIAVLSAWGPCVSCPEDIDSSGAVDFNDLLAVLSSWQ